MSVVRPHDATHPPHAHPEDEFFFVLEGRAEFFLDGHTRVVSPYTSLYCPPNVEHGIRNAGDGELKYLVIKKYPMPEQGSAGKTDTYLVEADNAEIRHYLARLVRPSRCFSSGRQGISSRQSCCCQA